MGFKMIEPLIAIVTVFMVGISIVIAETIPPVITDPLLTYLQAAGFPAWAGVVAWGIVHITNELRGFTQRLEAHILQTNERLEVLEHEVIKKI